MARKKSYLGPKNQIGADDLDRYERSGDWVAEEKKDGIWAECTVLPEGNEFVSRNDLNAGAADLGMKRLAETRLPREWSGTKLIGELEVATQTATKFYEKNGYRRFFVYDVIQFGSTENQDYVMETRRFMLEKMWRLLSAKQSAVFILLPQWQNGFRGHYEAVVRQGGEGLVLKKKGMPYAPRNSDGKVDFWIKVKKTVTADMVVMGVGIGAKTQVVTSLRCGLFKKGRLVQVCRVALSPEMTAMRDNMNWESLTGQVVEVEGFDIFKSGSMRSAKVLRIRTDKAPEECIHEEQ